jgi:hypothetical protein
MDRTFGLILLHRHFDLDANERLVDYGGTSVPWRLSKTSGNIRASCWLLSVDGAIRPYEFCYASSRDEVTEPDLANMDQQAFFSAFKKLLGKYNAEDLWGLCRYPGDDFPGRVEVTEGRANINLKPEDVSHPRLLLSCCYTLPDASLTNIGYEQYPKDIMLRTAAWFFFLLL